MPKFVDKENERDIKGGAIAHDGFSGAVRSMDLNTLQSGDIFTIPAPGYKVLERKIRGSQDTFEYVNVAVKRGEQETVGQLTPGLFWRNLEVADEAGNGTGERRTSTGEVVDKVQEYADLNSFFADYAGKQIKVEFGAQFMTPGFNGGVARKARVPKLTWVG